LAADCIRIGDPAIEVRLRRHAGARRMVLRVPRSGTGPTLTLPLSASLAAARTFLREQEPWLRRHLAERPREIPVGEGTVLPFGDGRLTVHAHGGRRLFLADGVLHVPGGPAGLAPRVGAFVKDAARRGCAAAVTRHAGRLGRVPRRISLRDPRSRWGSCTDAGDLMFSWRLALAPSAVLDYVVAHEVAHLAELNHSSRFWDQVRRLCPDFEPHRAWLRRHGADLHAFDFATPRRA
jgi:predicted metal-dependent hydrolase